MNIHGTGTAEVVIAPDLMQKLCTGKYATWVLRYGLTGAGLTEQRTAEASALGEDVALANLSPGTGYSVQIQATDIAGNTGTSAVLSFKTLPATPTGIAASTSPAIRVTTCDPAAPTKRWIG